MKLVRKKMNISDQLDEQNTQKKTQYVKKYNFP